MIDKATKVAQRARYHEAKSKAAELIRMLDAGFGILHFDHAGRPCDGTATYRAQKVEEMAHMDRLAAMYA